MKRWIVTLAVLALVAAAGVLPSLAQDNQARLRAVHASPGGPPVDVVVNGNTAFPGVAYKDISDYAPVDAGAAQVQVMPAGGNQTALIDATIDLQANADYTMVAVGEPENIEPLVLVDDNTPPAPGQARVRFVHASPNAPAVDVAVQGGQVLFSNVSFKGVGNYVSVPAGTVTLEVRAAGSDQVVLTVPNVALAECTVYTIYAVGLVDGQPPLEAITSTDATTTCAAPAAGATATPAAAQTVPATVGAVTPGARTGTPSGTVTRAPTVVTPATGAPTVVTPATRAPAGETPFSGAVTRFPQALTAIAPTQPPGGPPLNPP